VGVRVRWGPVVVVLLGGLLVSACASQGSNTTRSTVAGTTTPANSDGLIRADPLIRVRVELRNHQVTAGQSITGTLVVTSTASGRIDLTKMCEPSFQVVLGNRTISQHPAFNAVCSSQPLWINPGTNRFPLAVTTSYFECVQPGGSSTAPIAACGSDGPPPLPPGEYHTVLVGSGNLPLPQPPSVSVKLT
jgi:hypothetical protein